MVDIRGLRRSARLALVASTGTTHPSRAQLAAGFDLLCEQLRSQLRPLFGSVAIGALLERAVFLAAAEFTWLATVVPRDGSPCVLDVLQAATDTLPLRAVENGLAAVLAHEIGLLTTLLGDDFILPLVERAWGHTFEIGLPAESEGEGDDE